MNHCLRRVKSNHNHFHLDSACRASKGRVDSAASKITTVNLKLVDIELLRTFIAVTDARHFGRAADKLFLTPAAVSARIRQLEQTLTVKLFHRTRGNIQMTNAGERLLPHAKKIITAWADTQTDLALAPANLTHLRMGTPSGLWPVFGPLLAPLSQHRSLLSLTSHTHLELSGLLLQERLDMALMMSVPESPDIASLLFTELSLGVFSSTTESDPVDIADTTYLQIDWYNNHLARRQRQLGLSATGIVNTNDLQLALTWMARAPISAHLPIDYATNVLSGIKQLVSIETINLPIYLVYRAQSELDALAKNLLMSYQQTKHF